MTTAARPFRTVLCAAALLLAGAAWAAFLRLPPAPAEFAHIAANVPPYFPEP